MLLGGCATFSGASLCDAGPPPVGPTDHVSDELAGWIVTVDKSGRRICGWK